MADSGQTECNSKFDQVWPYCIKSTQYSIHSRRCFMTGEFCSKQANVHREREKLHKKNEINAFVVMNFSEMSDVVYKWKLQSFVESLKKHLYLDRKKHRIACVAHGKGNLPDPDNWTQVTKINVIRADSNTETNYVICNRVCQQMQIADLVIVDVSVENTNVFYEFGMAAAFNKLILPICYNESFYEMKLPKKAEKLLVELRQKNPVYYKKYKKSEYEENKADADSKREGSKNAKDTIESFRKLVEHHIDSYPWRRRLFEFYGIRYRGADSHVGYSLFSDAINPELGFSDERYNRFPYAESLEKESTPLLGDFFPEDDAAPEARKWVGYHIYNLLRNSYNNTTGENQTENGKSKFNTLVVYTMDDVLNEEQAGQCIINFYRNMTAQIRKERCFCGDRIGILGQGNTIHDDPKDSTTDKELLYKVSEIIRIGMNQATYVAQQRKIKTEEFLNWAEFLEPEDKKFLEEMEALENADTQNANTAEAQDLLTKKAWYDETIRFAKEHIRNRCIPIYPDEPIYVKQLRYGIQQGFLDQNALAKKNGKDMENFDYAHFFNLFHVMLYTLRYTNQIVVDLSRNSLQALFWLGMAHGSDVHAITVRHIPTKEDLERSGILQPTNERSIFDVAGLWTAIFHSNDTESFYRRLAITQIGIEQHSKLTLSDQDMYHESIQEQLYAPSPYLQHGSERIQKRLANLDEEDDMRNLLELIRDNKRVEKLRNVLAEKNREESKRLESFYRDRFWRRLLRYNDLRLYLPRKNGTTDEQPRLVNITWDVDSMAELSHYLSKRKIIGSYRQYSLPEKTAHKDAHRENFISIGGDTMPLREDWETNPESTDPSLGISLVTYVQSKTGNAVREMRFYERKCQYLSVSPVADTQKIATQLLSYRGFFRKSDHASIEARSAEDVFTQFVTAGCVNCSNTACAASVPKGCFICTGMEKLGASRNQIYFGNDPALKEPTVGENPRKMTLPDEITCNNQITESSERDRAKLSQLQLGQLLLWREVSDKEDEDARFWVSLEGISGPATVALTSLLVDDRQKADLLDGEDQEEKRLRMPLNSLQKQVRKKFTTQFTKNLDQKLGLASDKTGKKDDDKDADEKKKAKYAACLYLSTVLYQYFLPFLSKADENRICNGMHAYLCAMEAADGDNFKSICDMKMNGKKILQIVEEVLQETVRDLRGVEALYAVKVSSENSSSDTRKPVEIRTLKTQYHENNKKEPIPVDMVSCLFCKKTENCEKT